MVNELEKAVEYGVPLQYVIYTLIVVVVLVLAIIKVFPVISKWFNILKDKSNKYEELQKQVKKNSEDIQSINQKINKDYARLNELHKLTIKQQKYINESLEERELILRSILCVVQGLQEIGANGPTKQAEVEIQAYLLKKSHRSSSDDTTITGEGA